MRQTTILKAASAERTLARTLASQGFAVHRAVAARTRVGKRFITRSFDMFGVLDILAFLPGQDLVLAVQVTTKHGASARTKKVAQSRLPPSWLGMVMWHLGGTQWMCRLVHATGWSKISVDISNKRWYHAVLKERDRAMQLQKSSP